MRTGLNRIGFLFARGVLAVVVLFFSGGRVRLNGNLLL